MSTTTPAPTTPTPVADVTSPAVSFNPSTLSVASAGTGSATLSATDAVGISSGPDVTCTNGGIFNVATNVFTATAVTEETQSVCTATASDAAGNQGSATLTVTISAPEPDTTPPVIGFSPATLTVASGTTATAALTVTDAGGEIIEPTVSCTNGGSFNVATNVFTAAVLTADLEDTQSICTATATDAAGNEATAILMVSMLAPTLDTTPPTVLFDPPTLSVTSGQTGIAILNFVDETAVSTAPTVSCTAGGSFNVATNTFTAAADLTEVTESVCTATLSDDAGNQGTGILTVSMSPAPPSTAVTLSGTLTFDRVPVFASSNGLDFDGIFQMPIRRAPVELVNAAGTVLDSTVSDDNGSYSFEVESGAQVRVRVRSEIQMAAPNEIDMQVVDNTSGDALYALQGPVSAVPAQNQTRDLNASSGWGGSSYTGTRAAAPFALLDTIYGAMEDFIAVDPEVDFPAFDVQWSTLNRSQPGDVDEGEISTSSFTIENRGTNAAPDLVPVIRILGDENNDTDEYDAHVVVHEFGHYFENSLSRADSIGGPHSSSNRLDARVAFGEGWGNALSGMILDDPFYRDTFGNQQSQSFDINVENNIYPASTGWYSEGSVQSILYDLFDDDDDGADSASFGLGPIYGAFTDPAYANTEAFTTIFAFLDALENQTGIVPSEVAAITNAQDISGTTGFGVGETNNGGFADALPVYISLPTNGTNVQFCSRDNFGTFNRHGNRRYLEVDIPATGPYRITMSRVSGTSPTDPDFLVFRNGQLVGIGEDAVANSETQIINLAAGQHVIDAYAFENVDTVPGRSTPGDVCYTMSLEAQ